LKGFTTEEERNNYKNTVFKNILDNIISIGQGAQKLGIELSNSSQELIKIAVGPPVFDYMSNSLASLASSIKNFWADEAVLKVYKKASEFQLNDSAEYFFAHIERIGMDNYVPDVNDILRSRAKTTESHEIENSTANTHFRRGNVGGQRSERRKWIHCFEEVTAIIFITALSEYDQTLIEDNTTNRMSESLKLFKDIASSRWFRDTAIILFLNKKDIFETKITTVPLTFCFPTYTGPNLYAEGCKYIEDQFKAQLPETPKFIYVYSTCATDTENIKVIFNFVKHAVITAFLGRMGFGDMGSNGGGGGGGTNLPL